jgi:hypothetical protein
MYLLIIRISNGQKLHWVDSRQGLPTQPKRNLKCHHAPASAVLKSGHLSGLNRGLERFKGIADFLNFSGDTSFSRGGKVEALGYDV